MGMPPQNTALNAQYSGNQIPINPQLNSQYSANSMPMNPQLNMQYSAGNMMPTSPVMMMNYHQREFQKYFQMQQFPQQHNILNAQQLQQVQSMASYHYEQYAMGNQQQHALRQRQQQQYHLQQQQQQQIQFQKMQKQSAVPKVKFNKKKKEKLLKKRKAGVQMQYIKLQRYFQMNDDQKAILSQNLYEVQQQLQQYAQIQVVPELDCYELLIPSNTPLPQRKTYWQNVLKMTRNSIGMSMEHIMQ